MPELPEVETVCRGLEKALKGRRIESADVRRRDLRVPFPRGLAQALRGRCVAAITRRAKYGVLHLDDRRVMVFHLGMSGRMTVHQGAYRPQKHDHLLLHCEDDVHVALNDPRRFGLVLHGPEEMLRTHKLFAGLGPEPLGNGFSGAYLAETLKGKTTAIKQTLLDQRVVAGIGNIYACEALFMARIDPARPAGRVKEEKCEDLAQAVRAVLTRAIAAGGSSLRDYRQADGELGYFQHDFSVYDRADAPCPQCKSAIRRIVQGGRSTFFCARCQR